MPESPLLGGLALFAASYLEPGRVTVTAALPLIVGAGPGTSPELLERIVGVLRGALPIEVTDDIVGAQWTKLLINHVNALPAITGFITGWREATGIRPWSVTISVLADPARGTGRFRGSPHKLAPPH